MFRIVIEVDKPTGQAVGIKEDLAMYLEKFGDARVVDVFEFAPEQQALGAFLSRGDELEQTAIQVVGICQVVHS